MKPRLLKHYIGYRLKAKTRHGLHSPFVYQLLDEVIYDMRPNPVYHQLRLKAQALPADGKPRLPIPINQLLYRLTGHFKPANINIDSSINAVTKLYCLAPAITNGQGVCTVCDAGAALGDTINTLCDVMQPHDMLILSHIYQNPQAITNWRAVVQHPRAIVTINLFYFGMVFYRPGQHKENFTLRY